MKIFSSYEFAILRSLSICLTLCHMILPLTEGILLKKRFAIYSHFHLNRLKMKKST